MGVRKPSEMASEMAGGPMRPKWASPPTGNAHHFGRQFRTVRTSELAPCRGPPHDRLPRPSHRRHQRRPPHPGRSRPGRCRPRARLSPQTLHLPPLRDRHPPARNPRDRRPRPRPRTETQVVNDTETTAPPFRLPRVTLPRQPEPPVSAAEREAGDQALGLTERDRKSGMWGKSVPVRVDLGGRRYIKKTKKKNEK